MADYVEYQDLKVRVNTGDDAISGYTERKILTIDPDHLRVDLAGSVEDDTWIVANLDPAALKTGWWRFSASAIDSGGKLRKRIWYRIYIRAEGEV